MRILKDRKERSLLMLTLFAFTILCLVEANFGLPSFLVDTNVGYLLTNESFKRIVSGLCLSIVAAYVFYLFIDFIPKARDERDTRIVLDSLLAAILDAYSRCRIFGHETPISHVDKSVLNASWLREHKALLKKEKVKFLPLKFALQRADSRLEDFRHALPLAVSLSPKHAMQWLIIIDKVRLLAENYGSQPEVSEEQIRLVDIDSNDNPLKLYKSALRFRLLELIEQTIEWRGHSAIKNGQQGQAAPRPLFRCGFASSTKARVLRR